MKLNKIFKAEIITEKDWWTYVVWPESREFFGTGRAVKVRGTVDGYEFQTSFMPLGNGQHMLPLKAPLMKSLGKHGGDTIEVHLLERI